VERSVPQQNDAIRLVRRAALLVTWVALPLGATALLRAFPPLPLAGSGAASSEVWPLVAALAAAGSALAMLAWLFRAARTMPAPLAPLLVVAAAGALTAGWIVAALDEPARSSAEGAPPPAVAVALLAAAIPLAVAAVVGDRRLGRREAVVATAVVVLVWIEAAPAAGLFGADALRGLVPAIAAGAAVVLLLASARAAWDGSAARHAGTMRGRGQALRPGWVAGLATAAVTVVLARQGSALPPRWPRSGPGRPRSRRRWSGRRRPLRRSRLPRSRPMTAPRLTGAMPPTRPPSWRGSCATRSPSSSRRGRRFACSGPSWSGWR
jgi:hypothetical protein